MPMESIILSQIANLYQGVDADLIIILLTCSIEWLKVKFRVFFKTVVGEEQVFDG